MIARRRHLGATPPWVERVARPFDCGVSCHVQFDASKRSTIWGAGPRAFGSDHRCARRSGPEATGGGVVESRRAGAAGRSTCGRASVSEEKAPQRVTGLMPSSGHSSGHRRVTVRHRGSARRAWALYRANCLAPSRPRGPGGLEPGHGAFADQLPLELRAGGAKMPNMRRPAAVVVGSICVPWPARTRRPAPRADKSLRGVDRVNEVPAPRARRRTCCGTTPAGHDDDSKRLCADAGPKRIAERVRPGLRRDLAHLLEGADPESPGPALAGRRPAVGAWPPFSHLSSRSVAAVACSGPSRWRICRPSRATSVRQPRVVLHRGGLASRRKRAPPVVADPAAETSPLIAIRCDNGRRAPRRAAPER